MPRRRTANLFNLLIRRRQDGAAIAVQEFMRKTSDDTNRRSRLKIGLEKNSKGDSEDKNKKDVDSTTYGSYGSDTAETPDGAYREESEDPARRRV
jgi:hypothetical protein